MTIVYVLWLITSSYATQIGVYPVQAACVSVAESVQAGLDLPPRNVMARLACVPIVMPGGGFNEPKLSM